MVWCANALSDGDGSSIAGLGSEKLQQRSPQRDLIKQLAALVVEADGAAPFIEASARGAILHQLQHDGLEKLPVIDRGFRL